MRNWQEDFQKLNPEQQLAFHDIHRPTLILAGAGSGKTRTLTIRIAYLIQHHHVQPDRILAITFTNKATQEMQKRLVSYLGDQSQLIWISTFHSFCVRILREYGQRVGLPRSFTILDQQDQLTMIRHTMKTLKYNAEAGMDKLWLSYIHNWKNELIDPQQANITAVSEEEQLAAQLYEYYEHQLLQQKSCDFDGLIFKVVQLFQGHADVLRFYQQWFQYIHVDEYQDTNHAQYELCQLLTRKHQQICVVGDADQSIYRFRGADIRNILNFEKDYANARIITLTENYRSTNRIVQASNHLIANNTQRKPKNMKTNQGTGAPIHIYEANHEIDEANFIAHTVQMHHQSGTPYQKQAILFRTNAQSRVIEDAFVRNQIPYRMVGGLGFYDRKEIKDILAYLRAIENPDDDLSLMRALQNPKRGIGQKTEELLQQYSKDHQLSMQQSLVFADQLPIYSSAKNTLINMFHQLQTWRTLASQVNAVELLRNVLEKSKLQEEYEREKTPESETRLENIREFIGSVSQFVAQRANNRLTDFLMEINRITLERNDAHETKDMVTLMTIHSAKGLEFEVVQVAGMEEGIFPHGLSLNQGNDEIEEERRLMYVAMTRAEKELYLIFTKRRYWQNKDCRLRSSRFLREIPQAYVEYLDQYPKPIPVKQTIARTHNYQTGIRVSHKLWKEGTIVDIIHGRDELLVIEFDDPSIGRKQLLKRVAPLIVI